MALRIMVDRHTDRCGDEYLESKEVLMELSADKDSVYVEFGEGVDAQLICLPRRVVEMLLKEQEAAIEERLGFRQRPHDSTTTEPM